MTTCGNEKWKGTMKTVAQMLVAIWLALSAQAVQADGIRWDLTPAGKWSLSILDKNPEDPGRKSALARNAELGCRRTRSKGRECAPYQFCNSSAEPIIELVYTDRGSGVYTYKPGQCASLAIDLSVMVKDFVIYQGKRSRRSVELRFRDVNREEASYVYLR